MNAVLFGATGMVGRGVLHECLLDPGVERVLAVGRSATGVRHGKFRKILRGDLTDLSEIRGELSGYDACFFCLGVSSAGMTEERYRRSTYDLTLSIAGILAELNPGMTFVYVSGAGTDSTERGRTMWARVKGATENALLRLPFRAAYMFRPAIIRPLRGVRSRTGWYRILYAVLGPTYPAWKRLFPAYVTTSERIGRAMLRVAREGFDRPVLESRDIDALGAA